MSASIVSILICVVAANVDGSIEIIVELEKCHRDEIVLPKQPLARRCTKLLTKHW